MSDKTLTVHLGINDVVKRAVFYYQLILGNYRFELYDVSNGITLSETVIKNEPYAINSVPHILRDPNYGIDNYNQWYLVSPIDNITLYRTDFNYTTQNFTTEDEMYYRFDYQQVLNDIFIEYFCIPNQLLPNGKLLDTEQYLQVPYVERNIDTDKRKIKQGKDIYQLLGPESILAIAQKDTPTQTKQFQYQQVLCNFEVIGRDVDSPTRVIYNYKEGPQSTFYYDGNTKLPKTIAFTDGYYYQLISTPEIINIEGEVGAGPYKYFYDYKKITNTFDVQLIDKNTNQLIDLSKMSGVKPPVHITETASRFNYTVLKTITVNENVKYVLDPDIQPNIAVTASIPNKTNEYKITYKLVVTNPVLILNFSPGCAYTPGTTFILLDSTDKVLAYARYAGSDASSLILNVPSNPNQFPGIKIMAQVIDEKQSIIMEVDISNQSRPQTFYRLYGYNSQDNTHDCAIGNVYYINSSGTNNFGYINKNFPKLTQFFSNNYSIGDIMSMPSTDNNNISITPFANIDTAGETTAQVFNLSRKNYR